MTHEVHPRETATPTKIAATARGSEELAEHQGAGCSGSGAAGYGDDGAAGDEPAIPERLFISYFSKNEGGPCSPFGAWLGFVPACRRTILYMAALAHRPTTGS